MDDLISRLQYNHDIYLGTGHANLVHAIRDAIDRIKQLEDEVVRLRADLTYQKEYTEALDKNWETHHDLGMNVIRRALVLPLDSSIPDMLDAIRVLAEHLQDDKVYPRECPHGNGPTEHCKKCDGDKEK